MSQAERAVEHHSVATRNGFMPWFICGIGALFYCYEYLLRVLPSVATTEIAQHYHINAGTLSGLSSLYYWAYVPMQICVGILLDRYSTKLLLTMACLFCAVGTLLFTVTPSLEIASVGRFMLGFGSAFAFVGTLKLATVWLPPRYFALIAGITAALGSLGGIVGDELVTFMIKEVGWQDAFIYSGLFGVAFSVVIALVIKDHVKQLPKPMAHHDPKSILSQVTGILKNPQIWLIGAVGCLIYLPTTVFVEFWGPTYFNIAHHFSHADSATAVVFILIGFTIGAPLVGRYSDLTGQKRIPLILGSLAAAVLFSIVLFIPGISFGVICLIMLLLGMSYGAQIIAFSLGRGTAPRRHAGTALALTNMFIMLGGMIFQPLAGFINDTILRMEHVPAGTWATAHSFKIALLILPIGLILSAIIAYFIKDKPAYKHVEL